MRLDIGEVCLVVGADRIWLRAPGVIGGEFGWRLKKAAGGRSCVAMAFGMRGYTHRNGCVRLAGWRANCGSVRITELVDQNCC
jgi:hypothetical protein